MLSLCNHWEFVSNWFDGFETGAGECVSVRLPHTVRECPQHYTDHQAYQMVCGYRRKLELGRGLEGKHLFLQFDGAAHIATVPVIPASVWKSREQQNWEKKIFWR